MALCPQCREAIAIDAAECPQCRALFGPNAAWQPLPQSDEERRRLQAAGVNQVPRGSDMSASGGFAIFLFVVAGVLTVAPGALFLTALGLGRMGVDVTRGFWGLMVWAPIAWYFTLPAAIACGAVGAVFMVLHTVGSNRDQER